MELRQLRLFVAVAEEGSFSRAAARCHITQPALSRQIQALEADLGARLFVRSPRGTRLTPQGQQSYHTARTLLAQAERLRAEAGGDAARPAPTLSMGMDEYVQAVFPQLPEQFAAQWPGLRVEVRAHIHSARLVSCVAERQLDLCVCGWVMNQRFEPEVQHDELWSGPWILALPDGHPLLTRPQVTLADLQSEQLLGPDPWAEPEFGQQLAAAWRRVYGREPALVYFTGAEAILMAVAAGRGIGLFSGASRLAQRPGVVWHPLASELRDSIVLFWLRDHRPGAADTVAALIRRWTAQLGPGTGAGTAGGAP